MDEDVKPGNPVANTDGPSDPTRHFGEQFPLNPYGTVQTIANNGLTEHELGPDEPGRKIFRCADVGFAACNWEISGSTDEDLLPQIEVHGRQKHNILSFNGKTRSKVQGAIRDRKAA